MALAALSNNRDLAAFEATATRLRNGCMSFIGTLMILMSLMLGIATPLLVAGLGGRNRNNEANAQVLGATATSWAEWSSSSAFSQTAYWLECLFFTLSVATAAGILLHATTLYACLAINFTGTEETLAFLLDHAKEFAGILVAAMHSVLFLMLGLLFLMTGRINHAAGICMVVGIGVFVNILRGLLSLVTVLALDQHATAAALFEKAEGGRGDAELALESPV